MADAKEPIFRLKQFQLSNCRSAMRIGTDSLLLGAWCEIPQKCSRVLDVGCGTGIVGMMVAQRAPLCTVDAIDIDRDSVEEAAGNFAASPFANRLSAKHADFNDYSPSEPYELIVCNPPFFNETLTSPSAARARARHELSLTLGALFGKAAKMLSPDGTISVILPSSRANDAIEAATFARLSPRRICEVTTVPGKPSRRSLMQFSVAAGPCTHSQLLISDSDGNYTAEYKALLEDFCINF